MCMPGGGAPAAPPSSAMHTTFDDGPPALPGRGLHLDVLVARRRPLVVAASALPALSGVAIAVLGRASALGLGVAVAWLGLGLLAYVWTRGIGASERAAHVRADATGLFVDGRRALAPEQIRGGWVQPRAGGPPMVHVSGRRRGRSLALSVRDLEEARLLVRALGVDPARASAHYLTLARPLGEPRAFARAATLVALVLAFGVVAGQIAAAALALAVVTLLVVFVGATVPTHVTVGADGVLLRWLGTLRFIPWATVLSIEAFDGVVVLAIEGGSWLTLRTPADHERYQPERAAMIERMRVAWRAHVLGRPDEETARLLRRAGGRTQEWVRAMRAMIRGEGGYRAGSVPPERLWRVVEDPRADRVARTGAALALAPSLDEEGRERLRAASSSCAEPRLRVVLSTAATDAGARGREDDLAATLDALEGEGDDSAVAQ